LGYQIIIIKYTFNQGLDEEKVEMDRTNIRANVNGVYEYVELLATGFTHVFNLQHLAH
jgi:hypothetical protein